jgi:hypothetical protein
LKDEVQNQFPWGLPYFCYLALSGGIMLALGMVKNKPSEMQFHILWGNLGIPLSIQMSINLPSNKEVGERKTVY